MSVDLLHGDCREVLRQVEPESIDLVIADPPYGETSLDWDSHVDGWLEAVRRVMRPSASLWCFGSLRFFLDRSADFVDWRLAQDLIWEKHNGSNAFADRFRRVHEQAAQFYPKGRAWADVYNAPLFTSDATARTVRRKKRPVHWGDLGASSYRSEDGGPRLMRSVMCARSEHGRALHPTQKPVSVLLPLIEYSCPPGGLVLDPFAGSGSTGIAALTVDRSAVLIERRADYVEIARQRMDEDVPLLKVAAQ